MCTSNFVFLILFRILIYWNKVKCSHGLFTKIIWKESQKYHDTLCWRYMWTRWKCKKVWLKQVSVLQWKLTYTISEYLHMIVQQCAYRTTILIKLSFSWKCLAKCIMDKGVLPGILVCSEIFRGGMCISGGNANTIHNINLFSSNPHNNYYECSNETINTQYSKHNRKAIIIVVDPFWCTNIYVIFGLNSVTFSFPRIINVCIVSVSWRTTKE